MALLHTFHTPYPISVRSPIAAAVFILVFILIAMPPRRRGLEQTAADSPDDDHDLPAAPTAALKRSLSGPSPAAVEAAAGRGRRRKGDGAPMHETKQGRVQAASAATDEGDGSAYEAVVKVGVS